MFAGHDPYLVALSVVVAILGGYTGFGLAARIRGTPGLPRRVLLAGAAAFLAVGIWTMHFVGMLAAPIPGEAVYLVLPTIVSFLICALVVGVSLYFVSIGETTGLRLPASALLLGAGIVSMHYVGVHALVGPFHIVHRTDMILLSALIAILSAYGGLRIYLARQGGMRLVLSAVAFGIAVSGMHYTAMYGMQFEAMDGAGHDAAGLVASAQVLSLVVALLCFVIAAGFLLFLVPEPRQKQQPAAAPGLFAEPPGAPEMMEPPPENAVPAPTPQAGGFSRSAPLGGIGAPRQQPASRIPVSSADGTHLIDVADIRSIRADAHYTLVHDGQRERICSWSISEAESRLDPELFARVHRSHIVALPHVTLMRKEGDGAILELGGQVAHLVPVSRAKIAEVKARLGLVRSMAGRP
ncbi:MHYT domain-containing protein [Rhizobium sp. RU36D]|uniref:MHYT domain-containing protein n=1 Tax=Rhizobium sp. RU36D TaxID=1907415 RepID=UPI0009D8FAC4|nr:MHYT domain-containing protein [Rhizobium sp. RU36D]SMD10065.1 MHYT domain-containing protein, NO-binding membrane sensor [Rhizobium sp. RU36D]